MVRASTIERTQEAELEALWLAEAERRDEEMESGQIQGIPGDEVFGCLRARYGG